MSIFAPLKIQAQVAELVDALVSGTSVRKDVQVRVLFWVRQIFIFAQVVEFGRHATLRG